MQSGLISSDAALNVARDIIGEQVTVERHPVGFGNENWMIRTADGTCRWVLKEACPASC